MKRLVYLFLLSLLSSPLLGQTLPELSAYKYAIVETLFEGDVPDELGVSAGTRKALMDKGFEIVGENKESWPEELRDNPCLGLWVDLEAKKRSLGRKKVVVNLLDCRQTLLYSQQGFGNAPTLIEAYAYALNTALKDINAAPYNYDPGAPVKPTAAATEATPQTVAQFARDYLQLTGRHFLEGVYTTQNQAAPASIFIQETGTNFTIYDPASALNAKVIWASMSATTLPGVYRLQWQAKDKQFKSLILAETNQLLLEWVDDAGNALRVTYSRAPR